ncbi:MAG: histidinol-phosphatase HisJ family protein [Miltoncostaeaceae bacterium]
MLTDYHMHLIPDSAEERAAEGASWRADGGHLSAAWVARFVERARARAIGEIAVTEHVHRFAAVHDWFDNPWWREDAVQDIGAYCAALVAAREEHGLPVLVGLEMDWLPDRQEQTRALLAAHPFDIVLGSVHWLGSLAVDHPDFPAWEAMEPEVMWERYLEELVATARSGLFDTLSHPDLPKVFGTRIPAAVAHRWDDAVAAIAETGIAIECSSAGLRKPVGELYPEPGLLRRFREAGVPVTLGSDAHRPSDVGRDYPSSVAAVRIAGYTSITRFRGREPYQEPLS